MPHTRPHPAPAPKMAGQRLFHRKSAFLTQSTSGPNVVQIWSRYVPNVGPTKPAQSAVWMYRQSPLGPVDPSFRALSGRLKFTVRRQKFNKDALFSVDGSRPAPMPHTRPHPAPAPKMAVVGKKLTPTPVPKKGPSAHPYLQNRQITLSISDNKQ